ncbi:MAG: hypothetical protein SCALA702_03170 [Melioribacteraceae bacterium]|nr:MAG: hypothetical protein SCALA702_03170 [Melioribacteraceae bacterium]
MIFNCAGCGSDSQLVFEKIEQTAKKELTGKIEYLYNSTEEYLACYSNKYPDGKPVEVIVFSMTDGQKIFEYKFDQGKVFWDPNSDYILMIQLIPGMVMGDEDPEQFLTKYDVKTTKFLK